MSSQKPKEDTFQFMRGEEELSIPMKTMGILERYFLVLDPTSYELAITNGGCIHEYLLRLTAIINSGKTQYALKTTRGDKHDSEYINPVSMSTAIENISTDLESKDKFKKVREECKSVYGAKAMQELEESLGIDSRGIDANEYQFMNVSSKTVANVNSLLQLPNVIKTVHTKIINATRLNDGKNAMTDSSLPSPLLGL